MVLKDILVGITLIMMDWFMFNEGNRMFAPFGCDRCLLVMLLGETFSRVMESDSVFNSSF
jgi:ammonia channel protein AmtB